MTCISSHPLRQYMKDHVSGNLQLQLYSKAFYERFGYLPIQVTGTVPIDDWRGLTRPRCP